MPEPTSYSTCDDDLKQLFNLAEQGDAHAISALADLLAQAEPADSGEWQPAITQFWVSGLEPFAVSAAQSVPPAAHALVDAMLAAGLDSAALRALYEAYIRHDFASYEDQAGLIEALGLKQEDVRLSRIARKWQVLAHLTAGAFCYGRLGLGEIIQLDGNANEVKVAFGGAKGKGKSKTAKPTDVRRHCLALRSFLDNTIVVKTGTDVHEWLARRSQPPKMTAAELEQHVRDCVVSVVDLPLNLTRALLVPRVLTDVGLRNLTAAAAAAQPAPAAASSQGGAPAAAAHRWDLSRSLQELNERLKLATDFTVREDTNLANVAEILTGGSTRDEHAFLFASSLALLFDNRAAFAEWLDKTIADLAETALIWADARVFAETTDKLPGKQSLPWLKVTRLARGTDYLITATFDLPYRLWTQTAKAFEQAEEHERFRNRVDEVLRTGKATPDMLYWVWKCGDEALKAAYIANAPLIFKTLLKDTKGSYLKAQRDLHKMLLSDATFQMAVMNHGEEKSIASLVRCAKTMTLLNKDERQSLLVQIVRLFPDYRHLVEDKPTTERAPLPKITSARSMKLRQLALARLIDKLIPENRHDIEVARSYGDLRENSEYKFAKERQRFLNQRRSDYERLVNSDIRVVDFRNTQVTNTVIPGSTVALAYDDGTEQTFHILGMLDTDTERRILSFQTPLAKALLDHKPGDHITLPDGKEATIREVKPLDNDLLDWQAGDPSEEELISLLG